MSRSRPKCISRGAWGTWLLGMLLQLGTFPAQAIDAQVRAALELEGDAWIGQQVILKIELMSNGLSFSSQRIHLPDVPGALVLEDTVSTVKLSEQIDGETWQVLSYRYPLFAQRPGRIELAPVNVAFAVSAGFGSEAEHFELQTEPLALEVRTPPGVTDPAQLVTTTDFSLKVTVTPDPVALKVGDALTRMVTRTADAVSGMAFAPLPLANIAGVAVYPKTPEVDDRSNRGELTGTRVESVSYVLQQAGHVSIPGVVLQWWDPVAERLNTEKIPPLDLDVAVNPDLVPHIDPLQRITRLVSEHPWALPAGILAAAAIAWAMFRWLPSAIRRLQRWRRSRRSRESARFKALLQACRSNDPARVYNAYQAWLTGESSPAPDVRYVEALVKELERLQTALVRRDPDWRADAFLRELQAARNMARRNLRQTGMRSLPALNP